MSLRFSLVTLSIAAGVVLAQEPPPNTAPPSAPYLIAPGTRIPLGLINTISTKNAAEGDRVYLETVFPILVNGNIYAVDEDGGVYVYPAATEFKLLGKSSVHEMVYASPAVADGKLYIRGKDHLFCIGKKAEK